MENLTKISFKCKNKYMSNFRAVLIKMNQDKLVMDGKDKEIS